MTFCAGINLIKLFFFVTFKKLEHLSSESLKLGLIFGGNLMRNITLKGNT
jgi:hypothetical protein